MAAVVAAAGAALPLHEREAGARGLLLARERTNLRDALRSHGLPAALSSDLTSADPVNAIDGRDETAWTGRPGESQWQLTFPFSYPTHVGLLRAHWGGSSTTGVPTEFRWEVLRPAGGMLSCAGSGVDDDRGWEALKGTAQTRPLWGDSVAQPTRRSWFVDADACGLRLLIDRTNAALPVVREVQAIESAQDVLRGARASDDGAYPGFRAVDGIDGVYGSRWAGSPGKSRWKLRVDLNEPVSIDRVRLVLGFDVAGVSRPQGGRSYGVAWAPIRYVLEASQDGEHFSAIASEPRRPNGAVLPLRRRLVTLSAPRRVTALRLIMTGATGASGLPDPEAVPVVRELAAYRADDERPILPAPWILSVNANPSAQCHKAPGGEIANDAYHAGFLQTRFSALLPALRGDDQFARALGPHGEWLDPPSGEQAGEALESIEGDDPELDGALLSRSSPPPIVVLSGSNDWDYGTDTGPDPASPARWHWDPLQEAGSGGMGQLATAVQDRVAPFLGFCGGAQILALLEARQFGSSREDDLRTIDQVLQRTSGQPIRGFALPVDVDRAWPTDPQPLRAEVQFAADSPLFFDLAGPLRRSTTRALPEWHADAVRPDAFERRGPLERLEVVAKSAFCAPDVAGRSREGVFRDPSGQIWCSTIPEAFRSRDRSWPLIGAQFHAEQRDFSAAAPGDPAESVADARLFVAAVYEEMVDAYQKFGP
jgi:hypothetical protein